MVEGEREWNEDRGRERVKEGWRERTEGEWREDGGRKERE